MRSQGEYMFIGTNVYGWTLLAGLEGETFDRAKAMAKARKAGMTGWEDAFRTASEVPDIAEVAKDAGLAMRSAYVFGTFHTEAAAKESSDKALAICDALMPHGVTRFISNPDPLPNDALKTDAELRIQAKALEALGKTLRARGAELLYHTHTPEMLASAREFHHMMSSTDPQAVSLCLDLHWIWRGASNSMVALEDIIRLYGTRVSELHLRPVQQCSPNRRPSRSWLSSRLMRKEPCGPWIRSLPALRPLITSRAILANLQPEVT
jgi:inosose dehydratase